MNKDCIKLILEAAYEWRTAEVHAAACRLGIREDRMDCANEVEWEKLSQLRIMLDKYRNVLYT